MTQSQKTLALTVGLLLAALGPAVAVAAPPVTRAVAGIPPDEVLEENGAVIGKIEIRVENVFDPELPEEDRMLYRWANRARLRTRPRVVREQLLFRSGDPYSARLLRESERLLRTNNYLYDSFIRPIRYRGNQVDLEVWVKDVWTMKLGLGISRSGGENSTRFELKDTNLLGSGKTLRLQRRSDVDRTTESVKYKDPNIRGSRVAFDAFYSDNSDGERSRLVLDRPFFSLDSRWSAGLLGLDDNRIDALYRLGEIAGEFRQREQRLEVRGGLSKGLVDGRAHRWTLGMTYEASRFEREPERAPAATLPGDRKLIYPWVGYSRVEDAFETTSNQDLLSRTEDLFLGGRYAARLGLSARSFGADRNQAIFAAAAHLGIRPGPGQTLLVGGEAGGRWSGAGSENVIAAANARYYWRNLGEHLFFATVEVAATRNLDAENQLLLGGDSGLRGYPLRYQDGTERFLLTVEQRFFSDLYPFRLFYVGAAVFADIGRTWTDEAALSPNQGWLRDIGVGLRFGSARSGLGTVVHFDLAFPLDGDRSIDSVQWLVTTKETL